MSRLTEISAFIKTELTSSIHSLLKVVNSRSGLDLPFKLYITESYLIDGHVSESVDAITVSLSIGWIMRIAYTLELIEEIWNFDKRRTPLIALNLENAFDSYVYFEPTDASYNYLAVPFLRPLIDDSLDETKIAQSLSSFHDEMNENYGVGASGSPLRVQLPEQLSARVKRELVHAFEFIVLHECYHVLRGHKEALKLGDLCHLGEMGRLPLDIDGYTKKAVEVDADIQAFLTMIATNLINIKLENEESKLLFRAIYIIISCFDLSRRSIRAYQGLGSSHPMPDVRVQAMYLATCQRYAACKIDIHASLTKLHVTTIKHSVQSFQLLGMPSGAFYVMANDLVTIDRQVMPRITMHALMLHEINEVKARLAMIEGANDGIAYAKPWSFPLYGCSPEEFKAIAVAEAIRIFGKKTGPGTSAEKTMEVWMPLKVSEISADLGVSGWEVNVLVLQNHEMAGEYWEAPDLFQDVVDKPTRIVPLRTRNAKRYAELMGRGLELLMGVAEAKVVRPDDQPEQK